MLRELRVDSLGIVWHWGLGAGGSPGDPLSTPVILHRYNTHAAYYCCSECAGSKRIWFSNEGRFPIFLLSLEKSRFFFILLSFYSSIIRFKCVKLQLAWIFSERYPVLKLLLLLLLLFIYLFIYSLVRISRKHQETLAVHFPDLFISLKEAC
jgi:hypothetical protein